MKPQPAQGCREVPDMDCLQLRRIVLDGGTIAAPEAQRHLEECPACKDLADDNGALARFLAVADSPPGEVATVESFHDIESLLAREQRIPAQLASLPSSLRWSLTCLGLCIPAAIGLAMARADLALLPAARMVIEIAGLLGIALALCRVWLRPLYRTQPRAWTLFAILGAGLLLPWLLAALPPLLAGLPSAGPASEIVLPRAAACFLFGSALALPVMLGIGWFLGISAGVNAIILSFWIAAIISVAWLLITYKRFKSKTEIPFGPYLILGMYLVLIFRIQVLDVAMIRELLMTYL